MNILIIPHFKNTGGSGKYISSIVNDLVQAGHSITLGGVYAKSYNICNTLHKFISYSHLTYFHVPLYSGIRNRVKIFYLMKAIYGFIINKFHVDFFNSISTYDKVILTSSIQMPLLLFLKIVKPEIKVILLIQEHYRFGILEKKFVKLASSNNSNFIVITPEVKKELHKLNIESYLIPNSFLIPSLEMPKKKYTLLYVGGNQNIKGASTMDLLFTKANINCNILAIGYDNLSIEKNNRFVLKKGFEIDMDLIYSQCKVLVIPISAYHFSRPAIEAGLHGVPFIITDFGDIFNDSEYIKIGKNCLSFKSNDINDLLIQLNLILSNYNYFSENSYIIANKFVKSNRGKSINDII